jgi:excisionase family DNA binding protein
VLHWQGGDHTRLEVLKNRSGQNRHELILTEAACRLEVSNMTVVRLIRDGLLPARQICPGAPYVIRESELVARVHPN